MREFLSSLLDLLLPPVCARCRVASESPLCARCARELPRLEPGCIAPAGSGLTALAVEAPYEGEIESVVRRYKYPASGILGLDPAPQALLSVLLRDAAARVPPRVPDLVVAVPQHPRGLRRRGFDPAGILARRLASEIGLRFSARALVRLRDGPSQTGLSRLARRANVAGAFAVAGGRRIPARIWLVDDVVTTGATLREVARMLRRAGAREVTGVCVARTPDRSA
ncbi:adenine phosphoribosyltransferase [Myxococcaceae bacterium]|nr:adenine phosphoribosyltransferase [Myxococcaceae bacterium]